MKCRGRNSGKILDDFSGKQVEATKNKKIKNKYQLEVGDEMFRRDAIIHVNSEPNCTDTDGQLNCFDVTEGREVGLYSWR